MGFFDKLKSGLKKTKDSFLGKVDTILAGFGKIDEDLFAELEDVLISSDFGVQTTEEILQRLREYVKTHKLTEAGQIRTALQEIISQLLDLGQRGLDLEAVPA
ncbi:MAG: signal recognition particle receptor subunit alpha, partial [Clostridia bacterium]